MSIVLEKTWTVTEFNTSASTYNGTMLYIKTQLIAGAWDIVMCCNGDGVTEPSADDLWIDTGDIVWATAGSAHSWIVLSNNSLISSGAKFQVCFDLCNTTTTTGSCSGTLAVSYNAGFTGGTKTNRPTATDEIILVNNTYLIYGPSMKIFMSTDGECTRIIGVYGGYSAFYVMFEKLKEAPTWVTYPVAALHYTISSYPTVGKFALDSLITSNIGTRITYLDSTAVTLLGLSMCYWQYAYMVNYINGGYGNRNNYDGNIPALPMYFFSTTYSRLGVYGCLYDFYQVPALTEGSYVPSSVDSKGLFVFGSGTNTSLAIGSDGQSHGM